MMNPGTTAIARLIIDELPGLAGALQAGAARSASEAMRQQHSQNLANAMLAAASGLLMPSPNQYPLVPLQRLGAGLGAALQPYSEGAAQGRVLDALRMNGGGQARTEAMARPAPGGIEPVQPARIAPPPAQLTEVQSGVSNPGSAPAGSRIAARKTAPGGPMLRQFSGTLARRLEHPAVLRGGWELYGYEEESGRPVYAGPGQELRIYA